MAKFIQKRRRLWYAVLDIPLALRPHFGRPRFIKSLGTESLTEAERLVLPLVAVWKAEIVAARSGSPAPVQGIWAQAMEWKDDYQKATGQTRETYDGLIDDKVRELAFQGVGLSDQFRQVVVGGSLPTLDRLEVWLAGLDGTEKTKDMKESDVKRFGQRFPFTHDVSRKALERWIFDLQKEGGPKQKEGVLKQKTVGRIISNVRGYWRFLNVSGAIDVTEDHFSRLVPTQKAKTKASRLDERRPFSVQEVVGLLHAAERKQDTALGQLIWLAMWTGCRIEELCTLKLSSIGEGRLTVSDAKSAAGDREVPIHSRLEDLVTHLLATSLDGHLMSGLTQNKYGDRSNAIGKRFGKLKLALGYGPQHVFHSLRKTVATELQNKLVHEATSSDILGHEKPGMSYGLYSGGARLDVKSKAIETLYYPVVGTPKWLFSTPA